MLINAVIGSPIGHSISPEVHRAGYRELNIDRQYCFLAIDVKSAGLADFLRDVRNLPFRGVSITVPHKVSVIQYLDELSVEAKQINSVNTIVKEGQRLIGYNTDWLGVVNPLKRLNFIAHKKALVIGAGGAARSVLFALTQLNIASFICNRTFTTAAALADEFSAQVISMTGAEEDFSNFDIILNTTTLGMAPNVEAQPLAGAKANQQQVFFDCVYSPYETMFLKKAKQANAYCIHGVEMFLHQAHEQFKLYTGRSCSQSIMQATAYNLLNIKQV